MSVPASLADIDLPALRAGRLARLQAAMAEQDIEACLFFHPANVRYATGATTMTIYCLGSFVRAALVTPDGRATLFDHPNSMHLFDGFDLDMRPMHAWEYYDDAAGEAAIFAQEVVAELRAKGVTGNRIAVDKLAPVATRALEALGIEVVDSGRLTIDARAVKTPEEVQLFRLNGPVAQAMLASFEDAVTPGVSEQDLVATVTDTLLRRGGEYTITRGVASGPNTNPWRQESNDRRLEQGDLVFLDTDMVGIEGYFYCVSRTLVCGDVAPTTEQRDLYSAAFDWLAAARDLVRPGISYEEFANRAPKLAPEFVQQRYECLMHSCGLEDEGPSISYPDAVQPNPDRTLEPDMVVVVEAYFGPKGGSLGVKLGDQLLITESGTELLAPYPFWGDN